MVEKAAMGTPKKLAPAMIELDLIVTQERNIVRVAACAAVVALLIWIGAPVAEEERYPVRVIAPWLELESSDNAAIVARFDQPLQSSDSKLPPIEYVKFRDDWRTSELPFADRIVDRVQPTTCTELNALVDAGYVPWGDPIYLDDCTQLTLLRRARPARESYVRDFVMSAEAVDFLPAMLDTSARFDRRCQAYIANQRGVPWSVFDKIVEIQVGNDNTMLVSTEHRDGRTEGKNGLLWISGGWTRVSIVAWGDFNGDGVENLLIYSSSHPITWGPAVGQSFINSASRSDVYILTREAPGKVMRVVDAERHLTNPVFQQEPCRDQ